MGLDVGLVHDLLRRRRARGDRLLLAGVADEGGGDPPLAMFRNRTVGVSSVASVLIGVAMFGGLAALPLYLQIVKGATPTEAGLPPADDPRHHGRLDPVGSLISRTGQYRQFPIIGSGLLAVSLFIFHYVEYDTPLWQTMVVMLAFGIGLGFNFQPLTLAVQNAVPQQQIGVATSTATFTRQIGGALGTAVFLSILFSTAGEKIQPALRAAVPTADFRQRWNDPANAAVAEQFQAAQAGGGSGAAGSVLQDSSFLNGLDDRLAKPFLMGFSEAMDLVLLVGACVMAVGFLVMPPARTSSCARARPTATGREKGRREAQEAREAPAVAALTPGALPPSAAAASRVMTRPDELFTADRVVLPTGSVEPGWVRTAGDRITAAGGATPHSSASRHLAGTVVPGFVDVHCHGGGGSSFATGDAGHAVAAIATHRAHGTTSLVASLVSDTSEQLESAVRALAPRARR